MTLFERKIEEKICKRLFKGRAILLFGPRQAGKTTLSRKILSDHGSQEGYYNCDLAIVRQAFVLGKPELIKTLIGDKLLVVFDEAQTIQDIGSILKAFVDTYPEVQVIATGSSSFDLANKINEPLTGRSFEFTLLPLSIEEIQNTLGLVTSQTIQDLLCFGSYPAVVAEQESGVKEDILGGLATNYLYKDVYTFESIRNPRVFEELVKLLALQVGSLVSINELSQTLGVSRLTVEKYIRLLEQSYVVKVVRSFARNPRTEVKKAFKVFFYDVGIRNAVLGNFSPVAERSDKGPIFENFFVAERLKGATLEPYRVEVLFWRNRQAEEIDVIEVRGEAIQAFECKWKEGTQKAVPKSFIKKYPTATYVVVTPNTLVEKISDRVGSA